MSATHSLIIHGPRAFRLAKVGCGESEFCCAVVLILSLKLIFLAGHQTRHSDRASTAIAWWREDVLFLFFCVTLTFSSSTETTTPKSVSVGRSSGCVRCGTIKSSGALSCCGRGGSWFKKCGDAEHFDHTWAEGIQACKRFSGPVSLESPPQVMSRHMGVMVDKASAVLNLNSTDQKSNVSGPGSMSNSGVTNCERCVGLTRVAIFFYFLI